MPNTHEILTELVKKALDCHSPHDPGKVPTSMQWAITNAAEQIKQQERERMEILRIALNTIWTKPITEQLAHEIAGNALAEWEAEG